METEPNSQQLAELSALADGSLPPERRVPVLMMISLSAELRMLLKREQEVVAALREVCETERAPLALRLRIDGARSAPRARAAPRKRRSWAISSGIGAGALAAIALTLALVLPGGTPGAPSIAAAAAFGARTSTRSAPQPIAGNRANLNAAVSGMDFPNWITRGWTASGQRTDRLAGHRAVTVFYRSGSTQIAYTILASPPLSRATAPMQLLGGVPVQHVKLDGRDVVTWRRGATTCLLSGSLPVRDLEVLARY